MAIPSAILCLSLCAPCRASYALWEALGLSLAIPAYSLGALWAIPGRSLWGVGVRSALLILCSRSATPSGPLVGRPVCCQCVYMLALVLSLGLSLVLYIVPIVCYAARSPLGRTSPTRHLALSLYSHFHSKANLK